MPDVSASYPDVAAAVSPRPWGRWAVGLLCTLIVLRIVWSAAANPNLQWDVVWTYMFDPTILRGLGMTLWLTFLAMVIGFTLGTALALFRMSQVLPMQYSALVFVWLFRSIPTLVLLIFLYNIAILIPEVSIKIPFGPVLWSANTNNLVTPFVAAVIGLGFHKAAYMSEIIRAGLLSIDDGQRQAATALGMSSAKMLRRIVLPQAMRVIVPPTGSEIISTLKLTSLVSVISMSDLLYTVETIYSRTFQTVPLMMVACIWYLLLTSILQLVQRRIEDHFGKGYRARGNGNKDARPAAVEHSA
jgi:polar amino acid transport system permease protein